MVFPRWFLRQQFSTMHQLLQFICLVSLPHTISPVELIHPTNGEVWPLPQYIAYQTSTINISPRKFNFQITNQTCEILEQAVQRYTDIIKDTFLHNNGYHCFNSGDERLDLINVQLNNPCEEWPHLYMDETYEIHVNSPGCEGKGIISSGSVWGILRGLETFSQLITPSTLNGCLMVNSTDILDYPRFPWRGLLIDTSRHFLPIETIYTLLSAMEMNKMNVLHWHIVDDESFPYQSYTFPSLSGEGAYSQKLIYNQDDVKNIISFARYRGIRVVPEFDSPGHSLSWGRGTSKLLTPCFVNKTLSGEYGPIDPSRENNFKFMKSLLEEVKHVFPDGYIHIGGDEVDYKCWKSNPLITQFMEEKNITSFPGLEGYYFRRVLDILNEIDSKGLVWQEVFCHNASLRNNTVVHIWEGDRSKLLSEVTLKGNYALLSQGWYLDHLTDVWETFYKVDPTDFNGTRAQMELVLGGEACMWGEMVDETNIVPRTWPRASAVAERLWSSKKVSNSNLAEPRLREHVCRMRRRGVAAQPADRAGFCPY